MKANYKGGQKLNSKDMIKKAQKIQKQLEEALEELSKKEYFASSGGGMVEVVATGDMKVKSININSELLKPLDSKEIDKEMLEDLVIAAVNEAVSKAKEEREETIEKLSSFNLNGVLSAF